MVVTLPHTAVLVYLPRPSLRDRHRTRATKGEPIVVGKGKDFVPVCLYDQVEIRYRTKLLVRVNFKGTEGPHDSSRLGKLKPGPSLPEGRT